MAVQNLTARMVELAKAKQGGRLEIRDAKVTGLVFRVTPNGQKSWAFLYSRNSDGKKRRLTLGQYPDMSLAKARQVAMAARVNVGEGGDPAGVKRLEKAADSFAALADRYINRYARKQKRTWQEDQRIINRELNPIIGAMKAAQVKRRDIIDLLDDIAERPAPIMANRVLAVVRRIYRWAESEDLIDIAPVHGIKPRAKEQPRKRVLSEKEIQKFWRSLPGINITEQVRDILRLALLTGQRVGEIAGMRKTELDLGQGTWLIPAERTKNKQDHIVPLSLPVLEALDRITYGNDSEYVFPSRSGHVLAGAANRAVGRHFNRLASDRFVVHDLRRTVISQMAKLRIERLHISKTMNHKTADNLTVTGSTYDVYEYLDEKREALEKWAEELERIVVQT